MDEERRQNKKAADLDKISEDMKRIVGEQILTSFLLRETDEHNFQVFIQSLKHGFHGAVFAALQIFDNITGEKSAGGKRNGTAAGEKVCGLCGKSFTRGSDYAFPSGKPCKQL